MDPILRTSLIIVAAVAIRTLIAAAWQAFVRRRTQEPIPTQEIDGVYRAWGPVEKVRHWGWRLTQLWITVFIALVIALAYSRLAPAHWP